MRANRFGELAMHRQKALMLVVTPGRGGTPMATRALAAAASLACAASAFARDDDPKDRDRTGGVLACSLDGVNPALHPEIFGNPATARQLGFYQTPDHVWHVVPGCHR
jgi:hypothetical protein